MKFLYLTFMCLAIQAFFSMMEMACVSFNKVRLQYYLAKKNTRARWLYTLLKNPTRLFATTLIGVNASMQFGSECARRFYSAIGLNPDWSAISQIFLVLIFSELCPMFAARKHSEHVSMLGVPLLYLASFILRPLIWALDILLRIVNWMFRVPAPHGTVLSRDELQKAIEVRDEGTASNDEYFDKLLGNIFSLKSESAKKYVVPLKEIPKIPSTATVLEVVELLKNAKGVVPFILMYENHQSHVIAIVYPRDLMRLSSTASIRQYSRSPWFITKNMSVLQILGQFRSNHQDVAIVLDDHGKTVGIVTLDLLVEQIFHEGSPETSDLEERIVVEKAFPASMKVSTIRKRLAITLPGEGTLEDLMFEALGRAPEVGDFIRIEHFQLTLEKGRSLSKKRIRIESL